MWLMLGLLICLTMSLLGIGMFQNALLEEENVRREILVSQTFYTAESGLATLRLRVTKEWKGTPSLAGCFAGCGPSHARTPAYLAWMTDDDLDPQVLHLHSVGMVPGPAVPYCSRDVVGSLVEQRVRRIEGHEGQPATFAYSGWSHVRCPFSKSLN